MKKFRIIQHRDSFYVQQRFMFLGFIPIWSYNGYYNSYKTLGEAEERVRKNIEYYSKPKKKVIKIYPDGDTRTL